MVLSRQGSGDRFQGRADWPARRTNRRLPDCPGDGL